MQESEQAYCENIVRTNDEDRWLAAQYASPGQKRQLLALGAFRCELRRIPSLVSEPALGEIRLQWWRDALQEIRDDKRQRAHPVVEEIAETGVADAKFQKRIDSAIDANARPLYDRTFADSDDLFGHLLHLEGGLDAVTVELFGGDNSLAAAAMQAGAAFAMAREGKSLAPQLTDSISRQVIDIVEETSAQLTKAPAELSPALLHFVLTKSYVRRGGASFTLEKRIRIFWAMASGRL